MKPSPGISDVECALLVEDAMARVRHDVFNCLAAVRSASYYIQRRVVGTEPWQADPRVEKFFQLISEQLDAAVQRIGTDPKADLPHRRRVRSFDGSESVRRGIASLATRPPEGAFHADVAPGSVRADPDEVSLAVGAILGFLVSAPSQVTVSLRAAPTDEGYLVAFEAKGHEGARWQDSAVLPRPLAIARRVAVAAGGRFHLEQRADVQRIEFCIPDGAVAEVSILLVDDDQAGSATLAALLELEGFGVRQCSTLAEANAAVAVGDEYAVVLLDRNLPDGSGELLVPAIRSALPNAKIVLVTGDAPAQVPPGFDAAHLKGLDPIALLDLVKAQLSTDVPAP
jgi:CheY-like chemotaxis protein